MYRYTFMKDRCYHINNESCFQDEDESYWGAAIDRLGNYEDLEEEGRLIKFPCKIGDTIYQTRYKCICTLGHTYLHNTCNSPIECTKCRAVKVERWVVETTFSIDMLDRIGKDFFLTRKQAEAALDNI